MIAWRISLDARGCALAGSNRASRPALAKGRHSILRFPVRCMRIATDRAGAAGLAAPQTRTRTRTRQLLPHRPSTILNSTQQYPTVLTSRVLTNFFPIRKSQACMHSRYQYCSAVLCGAGSCAPYGISWILDDHA